MTRIIQIIPLSNAAPAGSHTRQTPHQFSAAAWQTPPEHPAPMDTGQDTYTGLDRSGYGMRGL
jgi:hypothetical protein